ncbi:MAG TPA: chemotaxis protein CheX [Bryobacteraceae bacterium]|jgi:hypothetical protein|nr:chemotaxis protein CheX [Bryobacteraceae bacterium]
MTVPGDVICQGVEEILEKMYFCEAECLGLGRIDALAIASQVTFSGDLSGRFVTGATEGLAARLAADFVAADIADVTASQATEIIHEFTNVACAAALAEWLPHAKLNFSLPSSVSETEVPEQWSFRFGIDGAEPELAVSLILASG